VNATNLIAFSLRLASALAKLVFVTYLGYFSYHSLIGQFAMISTMAIVFTQVAGLEINQTIGRQLHSLNKHQQERLYKYQAIASLCFYLVLCTFILILYKDLLKTYWIAGVLILCLEHYTTELYRFHILTINPFKASMIMFVKNVGWVWLFIVLHHTGYISADIGNILLLWLAFLLISAAIGGPSCQTIANAYKHFDSTKWYKHMFELVWSSKWFLVSAIAVAGIGAVDKLLIGGYFTLDKLGQYYSYQTIASIPALVVSFSIGATLWPKCIKLSATGKKEEYSKLWKKLNRYVILLMIVLSSGIAVTVPLLFETLKNKPTDYILLYTLISANLFLALCDPFKLKLYISHHDLALVAGNVTQLLLIATVVVCSLAFHEIKIVALSVLLANAVAWIFYNCGLPSRLVSLSCFTSASDRAARN
jgi:O-antigen/teichoic acid export membrane protein